ncbi:sensor histidine kinase [uncultured Maribacter sp.]|uniref:sensor histidine kinase n=1 Tax=uncultured Maribacter sp. TaxID=431308 RepID=UPI0030EB56C2
MIISNLSVLAQEKGSLINSLRKHDLKRIYLEHHNIDSSTKKIINWQLNFLEIYEINEEKLQLQNPVSTITHSALGEFYQHINYGDYLFYKYSDKNVQAKEAYLKALKFAVSQENIEMECEAIKRILDLNRHAYLKDNITTTSYLKRYESIAYDHFEEMNYKYYNLLFSFQYFKTQNWNNNDAKNLLEFANTGEYNFFSAKIFQLLAIYEHVEGNNDIAIGYEEKAIERLNLIPYNYKSTLWRNAHYALARYNIYSNNALKASEYLTKIDNNVNNRIEEENHKYYFLYKSILDSINGNFSEAYRNLREFNNKDVFFSILNNQNAFNELESKYQTAEKEKQILVEKQKAQITRNWLIAATIALVFGAGIAILVQKNTTKKRKLAEQETLLKQERVDNLLKQQELVSIDAMIEGQEKERQRVANELHDDLGSLMATIKLHFGNVKGKDKDPALKQAQTLLEEAYQKVRGIAHRKNSGVMSSQGLLPAVKKMAQVISETNALEVSVEDFGMGERMENSLELSLFRTIQELVANTIKHAEATKLNIQISQYEDNLNIIIEDNGKGFDRSNLDKSKTGMGLTNIEKRIEHLEGNFTIDSVLGKGTSIIIDIPV